MEQQGAHLQARPSSVTIKPYDPAQPLLAVVGRNGSGSTGESA
jgi:hypothetical protein